VLHISQHVRPESIGEEPDSYADGCINATGPLERIIDMPLRRALKALLESRAAYRGDGRGNPAVAFILTALAGRRGALTGRLGSAGLAFMVYQALKMKQARDESGKASGRLSSSVGDIVDALGGMVDRFGRLLSQPPSATHEVDRVTEWLSDPKALLLIRAMIAAAHTDGSISLEERAGIMERLEAPGGDIEDRRAVEREIDKPKPLDELISQVRDHDTALKFYLVSRMAMVGVSDIQRAYLERLRLRLHLNRAEVAAIDRLAA
jgi:uncharacterized membrane protein YebE (DUF533 family)